MIDVPKIQAGSSLTQDGGLTIEGAIFLDLLVRAVRELQDNPVFPNGDEPILTSPNGTQYRLTVDNAGNLSTTAV